MQILRGGAITVLPAAFGIALLIGTALAIAAPATELQILATDPAPDGLLAREQRFFVRFEVKSAAPVAVTASGSTRVQQ